MNLTRRKENSSISTCHHYFVVVQGSGKQFWNEQTGLLSWSSPILPAAKQHICRGAPGWVQSVKRPTSAQVVISQLAGSSPASGSVMTAQSLEPISDLCRVSLSLFPFPAWAFCLSVSLSLSKVNKHFKTWKYLPRAEWLTDRWPQSTAIVHVHENHISIYTQIYIICICYCYILHIIYI